MRHGHDGDTHGVLAGIREGDVIGFVANKWNIGHALIRLGQIYNGGDNNGFHNIVHVGIVVEVDGVLSLVEFTVTRLLPWPSGGMVITPLDRRINGYQYGTVWFQLGDAARHNLDIQKLRAWVDAHRQDGYNVIGLIFAILQWFVGWAVAGKLFCSEAVRSALSESGAWNGHRYTLALGRHPRRVESRVEPQRFSPRDVAEAGIWRTWEVMV
jgi:hypothetical protein